jgi:hypothetical protein
VLAHRFHFLPSRLDRIGLSDDGRRGGRHGGSGNDGSQEHVKFPFPRRETIQDGRGE